MRKREETPGGGEKRAEEVNDDEKLPIGIVDNCTLRLMSRLIKLEFYTSLQKELDCDINKDDGGNPPDPHPWDVYSVKPTNQNGRTTMAVIVPYKKDVLMWFDENENFWHIKDLESKKKVSSLSGTVRVLENLGPLAQAENWTEALAITAKASELNQQSRQPR